MTILEQFERVSAPARAYGKFRPATQREYVALQLARKFNDLPAVRHYAEIAPRYEIGQLLRAYSKAMKAPPGTDLGRRFHEELKRAGNKSISRFSKQRLVAIRVDRRAVAVAVTFGKQLEHVESRQLSSKTHKAIRSAVGFVASVIRRFRPRSAALEIIPSGHEVQRSRLTQAIKTLLREQSLSVWEVSKQQLFDSFGHPPLSSRRELREIVTAIWPILAGDIDRAKRKRKDSSVELIQDAEALAIYCQTQRHFINDQQYI